MRATFLLIFVVALGYSALLIWRRRKGSDPADKNGGFRPHIGFTRLDGMAALSLLLENESKEFVWAEEIEVSLSDLSAEKQTAEPTCREIQKIRQMVRSGDMLPISLCEVIYKAAGGPQRKYSCVLSSVLRYRIGEERFEKNMENFRLRMMGLTISGVQRERKPVQLFQAQEKSQDAPAIPLKLK